MLEVTDGLKSAFARVLRNPRGGAALWNPRELETWPQSMMPAIGRADRTECKRNDAIGPAMELDIVQEHDMTRPLGFRVPEMGVEKQLVWTIVSTQTATIYLDNCGHGVGFLPRSQIDP